MARIEPKSVGESADHAAELGQPGQQRDGHDARDDADLGDRLGRLDQRVGPEEVLGARQRVDAPEVGLERLAGGPEADHPDAGGDAGEHAGQRDRRDGQQRGLAGGSS